MKVLESMRKYLNVPESIWNTWKYLKIPENTLKLSTVESNCIKLRHVQCISWKFNYLKFSYNKFPWIFLEVSLKVNNVKLIFVKVSSIKFSFISYTSVKSSLIWWIYVKFSWRTPLTLNTLLFSFSPFAYIIKVSKNRKKSNVLKNWRKWKKIKWKFMRSVLS